MSEEGVDLSQIRGDWQFHMHYVQNAIDQTMKRQHKLWDQLGAPDSQLDEAVKSQAKLWHSLKDEANAAGTIPTADYQLVQFIAACRDSKTHCDEFEDREDSDLAADFTESCRQIRAMCDDVEMMIGQRPDNL